MSQTPAAPAKAKGSKSTIVIVAAVLLVAAGGGGGYFWYSKHAAAAAAAATAAEESDVTDGQGEHGDAPARKKKKKRRGAEVERLMSFEPFVVNLADPGASRFLRTNIQLVVYGGVEEAGGHGESKGPTVEMMRARSAILELLAAETSDQLTTPQGKDALKKQIVERMEDVLDESGTEVEDVLFSDFVIQF